MEKAAPNDPFTAESPRVLVLNPHVALAGAQTRDVHLFERCPPVHSILLGRCRLEIAGRHLGVASAIALPANTTHRVLALDAPYACVAYVDPRRYRFDDVRQLAAAWRGFVPGRDDLREAFGAIFALPRRRIERRIERALDAIETEGASVAEAAAKVGLSDSRLTHLMTETLGAPPRTWRAWLKLRRAIGESVLGGVNLTRAAHVAGFADSAHFTRTCKRLTGVRPAQMMPQTVYVMGDE